MPLTEPVYSVTSHAQISSFSTAILALRKARSRREPNLGCRGGLTDLSDVMLCQKILYECCRMCRRIVVMKLICSLGHCEFNPKLAAVCISRFSPLQVVLLRLFSTRCRHQTLNMVRIILLKDFVLNVISFGAGGGPLQLYLSEATRNTEFQGHTHNSVSKYCAH
jgi:hypothetical protein